MFELYSVRNKPHTAEPEVFVYDSFPTTFRNQFFAITRDAIIRLNHFWSDIWGDVCKRYAREKGLKHLIDRRGYTNNEDAFENYVDKCSDSDFLDIMDFVFGAVIANDKFSQYLVPEDRHFLQMMINELNHRLKQHNLGYEFCNGEIIKKTNTVTHKTIVKPALKLLVDEQFRGAEEEYMKAWKHFTHGENKEAIMNAAKAFESTMKTICANMGYAYDRDRDDARKLLSILKTNSFFPSYLESHLNAVCTTLESGAPTVRNKTSGHGQGEEHTEVPDSFVTYVLNLVATNIVFLGSLFKAASEH